MLRYTCKVEKNTSDFNKKKIERCDTYKRN